GACLRPDTLHPFRPRQVATGYGNERARSWLPGMPSSESLLSFNDRVFTTAARRAAFSRIDSFAVQPIAFKQKIFTTKLTKSTKKRVGRVCVLLFLSASLSLPLRVLRVLRGF